ncbi:carboxypeptidase-like regulatory domain-containing protein [uncultured Dokdonia sp.]|uniref:carboxypeptidase-like regulatory domain-containing protein n=1 Tax=uncultured Dokdonia sp. TaxID=575653 RepID=UPI00261567DA|nr:carboxypeptidase-like regulatory domain-containing protein [uncultured Dokdonia sp.]
MKKPIAITIPKPCHEDWAKMTPVQQGKHCAVCSKEVVDFTAFTKDALYKRVTKGDHLCGRFRKDQLDTPIYATRDKGRSFAQAAAALLVPMAMLSVAEASGQTTSETIIMGDIAPVELPVKKYDSLGIGTLSRKQNTPQKLITITGTVTDYNGPLAGVTISVEGTSRNYKTDLNGNYSLNVFSGEIITYSYLGFQNREIKVGSQLEINVNFQKEERSLPQIIMGRVSTKSHKQLEKELRQKKKNKKQ